MRSRTPSGRCPLAFLAVIILGASLLMLPLARTGSDPGDPLMHALFTSVSAVCVTGLITVDTATYWTPFGQTVILGLIQVGGFGIMTLATLLALLVRKSIGLRGQLVAQSETHTLNLGDVRSRAAPGGAGSWWAIEAATAAVLTGRFWLAYDQNPATALWHGVFHAVSSFNNAGFALYSDNLIGFAEDPWIIVPICLAIIGGGLGFPVIIQLLRGNVKARNWSVHLRLTIYGTLLLLALGITLFAAFEWNRDETLGGLSLTGKLLGSLAGGVFPRTAGFNSIDYGAASPETLMVTNILMFIGGGSAGTAGGIKITTFLVLGFSIWNEVRGRDEVTIAHRSISASSQRQALSVALLGVAAVVGGTLAPAHADRLQPGKGTVRIHLRVRHRRDEHRHHLQPPAVGRMGAYGPDVHRQNRHRDGRVGTGPLLPAAPLQPAGGTPHHRLEHATCLRTWRIISNVNGQATEATAKDTAAASV